MPVIIFPLLVSYYRSYKSSTTYFFYTAFTRHNATNFSRGKIQANVDI